MRAVSRARSIPTKRLTVIVNANVRSDLDASEQERIRRKILNGILDGMIDLGPQPRPRPSTDTAA